MKSLVESLFDSDLVSKDTGYEYLYGLVEKAAVSCNFKMDYFDEKKIKQEFNKLSKKFPPKDWSYSSASSMKKFQVIPQNEILRELLYIITDNVKTVDIKDAIDLHNIGVKRFEELIYNIIKEYLTEPQWVSIDVGGNRGYNTFYIGISFQLGKSMDRYSKYDQAGFIRIIFNKKLLTQE